MKSHFIIRTLIASGLLSVLLACSISFGGKSDPEKENLEKQLTLQALQIRLAASSSDQDLAPHSPTGDSSNQSQEVNQQPSPTPTDDGIPCNSSKFVSETIPDFTVFQPGATFQKSWTLRNAGDCDWTEDYVFEFEEGNRLNGESSIKVNTVIEPSETNHHIYCESQSA